MPLRDPAGPSADRTSGDNAPRWHAPPRPRSTFEPPATPPPTTPQPSTAPVDAPTPEPSPAHTLLDRLGPPFLALAIICIVVVVAWPVVRESLTTPTPTATVYSPTRSARINPPPLRATTYACFGNLALAAAEGTPTIDRTEAERRYREGYEFPLRVSRLTTISNARLVHVGPGLTAMRTASSPTPVPTRLAWLLTFGRTEPLSGPFMSRATDSWQDVSFTYALLDAASGETIGACDGIGSAAKSGDFDLPPPPHDLERSGPLDRSWAQGPPGGRIASWIPYMAVASSGTAIALPDGQRELVADYFAADRGSEGARIQIITTTHPPLLRLGAEGGTPIALDSGREARLDLLGTTTVLTWREGDLWYQIIAVRPQQIGPPFGAETVMRIAEALRSREDR